MADIYPALPAKVNFSTLSFGGEYNLFLFVFLDLIFIVYDNNNNILLTYSVNFKFNDTKTDGKLFQVKNIQQIIGRNFQDGYQGKQYVAVFKARTGDYG